MKYIGFKKILILYICALETSTPRNLDPLFEQVKKSIYHTCVCF
jgi:hypothetical protein